MEIIGIIGAMDEEVMALKERMNITEVRGIASLEFYLGTIGKATLVVVMGGIGKVNAAMCTQLMIDCFHVDAIINTGVAGALSDELEIGDVVISLDMVQHDVDAVAFGYQLGQIPRMNVFSFVADERLVHVAERATDVLPQATNVFVKRIVSGDKFVADKKTKQWLIDKFDGFCTEMEGAAVAQVAHINKIPFVIIRSISDKADDSAEMNFEEFVQIAAYNSFKMVEKMLELL